MPDFFVLLFYFSEPHKKEKMMETGEYSHPFILLFNYPNVFTLIRVRSQCLGFVPLFVFTAKTAKKEVKVHGKNYRKE